ncbi:hypothetical protein [Ralstonia pseudosolanacearum]|uniref:hypothetical protein n=1 Tax=Ralstonia pseudosolanacearum TaxID=1310165 RepID=UPI003CF91687
MRIDKQSFEEWAAEKAVEFSSTTVAGRRPGTRDRLVFYVIVAGGFKVTKGYETLYTGPSFDVAADHFNAALPA